VPTPNLAPRCLPARERWVVWLAHAACRGAGGDGRSARPPLGGGRLRPVRHGPGGERFFSPIAGLGLALLLLRDGACAPAQLPRQLGMALALWWPAVLLCALAATALLAWSLPSRVPLTALAAFALADVGTTSFVELAARVEQAQHRVGAFGAILTGLILARLIGLLLYAAAGQASAVGCLWVYAMASALYAFVLARRMVAEHAPIWPKKREWAMARESFPFTIGALSFRLQAEFNKPLLARASYGQAGSFGVAAAGSASWRACPCRRCKRRFGRAFFRQAFGAATVARRCGPVRGGVAGWWRAGSARALDCAPSGRGLRGNDTPRHAARPAASLAARAQSAQCRRGATATPVGIDGDLSRERRGRRSAQSVAGAGGRSARRGVGVLSGRSGTSCAACGRHPIKTKEI